MTDDSELPTQTDKAMSDYLARALGNSPESHGWEAGFRAGLQFAMAAPEWSQAFVASSHFPALEPDVVAEIIAAVPIAARD